MIRPAADVTVCPLTCEDVINKCVCYFLKPFVIQNICELYESISPICLHFKRTPNWIRGHCLCRQILTHVRMRSPVLAVVPCIPYDMRFVFMKMTRNSISRAPHCTFQPSLGLHCAYG